MKYGSFKLLYFLRMEVCSNFLAALGAPRAKPTLPRQKKKVSARLNVRISLRASGLKVEAECKHFLFMASANNRARYYRTVKKIKRSGVAVSQSNAVELFFFKGALLCLTATVVEWIFIFHTAFHTCHACCLSDV